MNADELIQYLSWAVYIAIFVVTAIRAVRRPLQANVDIAVLFASAALVIILSALGRLGILRPHPAITIVNVAAILLMAHMLLRLMDDFAYVPTWVMRSAEVILALFVLATAFFTLWPPATLPAEFTITLIVYLILVLVYTTAGFVRASQKASGVTRRRMRAVAIGSIWLAVTFLISGFGSRLFPQLTGLWTALGHLAGLGSSLGYYVGFATPGLLRRAWQEPELRAFLGRAARLPRLPTTEAILREMEVGAAASVGAPNASIGLWDETAQVLRFTVNGEPLEWRLEDGTISGQAFTRQQALFTDDLQRDQPAYVGLARARGVKALLVAPITAGEKRLGVLAVYAPRAPIFADEDLEIVQLLADQAAVILESRALIDEAARVRAREEVTRLKDDFLSAAAHDLKTPLTTLVGQSQLLERRALRDPAAPADLGGIQKIVREAQRLRTLVLELLDASRAEQGRLVTEREQVDLTTIVRDVCARHVSHRHSCELEMREPVVGMYDPTRIQQLIDNLVENAVKYSPEGGQVRVNVWREDGWNHLTVSDQGIGIPSNDLPHIFERFHRASNVDDRRFAGMGLGLFICKGIAEEHGGRISAASRPGQGSTFHVTLPVQAEAHAGGNHSPNGN